MERFCEQMSAQDDIWFATNLEIYDYITALRGVSLTVDRKTAYNPSATDLWLEVNGEPVLLPAGKLTKLD